MSSDVFSMALDAINKAKEHMKSSQLDDEESQHEKKKETNNPDDDNDTNEDDNNHKGPETMSEIEERYETRKKVEAKKDQERAKEINRFMKDVDDASVNIDLQLRQMINIQNDDLAEKFGVERNDVDESASNNMKALADRQMREKAILTLQNLTTRFTSKRIHDELLGTKSWLETQQHNHVKTFEKIGVAVSEIDNFRPNDNNEKDVKTLLESSEELMSQNNSDTLVGSAHKLKLLAEKFKETKQKWKKESFLKVKDVEEMMNKKAQELRLEIRKVEESITNIKKLNVELDQQLNKTKEGKMREDIKKEVKDIERRYQYHIDRQQQQIDDIEQQLEQEEQVRKTMQNDIQTNDMNIKLLSTKPGKRKSEQQQGDQEENTGSSFELEQHISNQEQEVQRLQELQDVTVNELKDIKGLSDDRKDELTSLQQKSKDINVEINACINRQKTRVRILQSELQTLTNKKMQLLEETDQVHDRIMKLSVTQSRRKDMPHLGTSLNLDEEDGQDFLMKAKLASSDVSAITADRIMQKMKENQYAPGHTRLWPNPNVNNKQDLIHFVEHDDIDEDEEDIDGEGVVDFMDYKPSCISHVCEASYLHFYNQGPGKGGKEKAKKSKNKKKKDTSTSPTYSPKEAIAVFILIIKGLLEVKHLDKMFLNTKIGELNDLNREVPIMKPVDAEQAIYKQFCVPLINHILTHQINNIIAENKMFTVRLMLISTYGILGILFMCLPNILQSITCALTPHPGFLKHIEDITGDVISKFLTSTTKKTLPEDQNRPKSRAAQIKKTKSGKTKGKNVKEIEVDDPLHPRSVYLSIEACLYKRTHQFKRIGLKKQIDVVRQWVSEITTKASRDKVDDYWSTTSSNGAYCKGKVMYSEDRFGLCAYQILLYELSSYGLIQNHDIKYKNMSGNSLNNFKECLENIKRPSSSYTKEFGNVEVLLKSIVPASIPIVLTLEFLRKLIDEELAKQSIFTAIESGKAEELGFLKSSRTSTAASSRLNTAAREDAFLRGLPEDERRYLLDMQMSINLAVDDVLEALEVEDDGGDDYDTVKVSPFLKKHITKHMYILDDIVFSPFDKEALPKVKSEIYKFQKHIEALRQARKRTLDVGGEYTKPLRGKLELLNDQLASYLETFHQKCYESKIYEAEIIEMEQETKELYDGNRSVIHQNFTYYPDELERIMIVLSKNVDSLLKRRQLRQELKEECSYLRQELSQAIDNYIDIKGKLLEMGRKLSYTSGEALTQGAHIILSLLSDFLMFVDNKDQPLMNEENKANINEFYSERRRKDMTFNLNTEKILRHILSYFDEKDFSVLGAVYLDQSISRSMSQGLEEYSNESDKAASFRVSLRSGAARKEGDIEGENQIESYLNDVDSHRGTEFDEFHFSPDKESKHRQGTGADPRKVTNKKERKMSTIRMDSMINDSTMPLVNRVDGSFQSSRENTAGSASRRASVARGFDSRPTSQQRRQSHLLHHERQSSRGASRETDDRLNEISQRLLDQYLQPHLAPKGQSEQSEQQQQQNNSIKPPAGPLPPIDDSDCASSSLKSVSISTTKPTNSKSKSNTDTTASSNQVPLLNNPRSTSRKATLALLSSGDGKVASYVAK